MGVGTSAGLMFVKVATGPDADALAYIAAVESTGYAMPQVEKDAVDALVKAYKANGTWSKKYAVFLISGNTAASQKWNLKDPRDLDAAYRMVWLGGTTHSNTGVKFNGTDSYGNPFVSLATLGNTDTQLGAYATTEGTSLEAILSVEDNTTGSMNYTIFRFNSGNVESYMFSVSLTPVPVATAVGLLTTNVLGTAIKIYQNGVVIKTNTASGGNTAGLTRGPYFGAHNSMGGGVIQVSSKNYVFAELGRCHTDAEVLADYNALRTYLLAIGRIAA